MLDYETTARVPDGVPAARARRPDAQPCGRCDNCAGAWYPAAISEDAAGVGGHRARSRRRGDRAAQAVATGADRLGVPVRGRIAADEQLAPGRALARLTDLGWGGPLRELLAAGAADQACPPALLAACIRVLGDWDWARAPGGGGRHAVRTRPMFVESLARGIAEAGRLPFLGSLGPRGRRPVR